MAQSIDELQIGIVAEDKASDTIVSLSNAIRNLGDSLARLDAGKLKTVVNALNKLDIKISTPDLSPVEKVTEAVESIGKAAQTSSDKLEKLTGKLSKKQRIIEGNEIKEYERGFTMRNPEPYKPVEYPPAVITKPIYEQANAYTEKLLPAVIEVQDNIQGLYNQMVGLSGTKQMLNGVVEVFDRWKREAMEASGAIGGKKWVAPDIVQKPSFTYTPIEMDTKAFDDVEVRLTGLRLKELPACIDQFENFERASREAARAYTEGLGSAPQNTNTEKSIAELSKQASTAVPKITALVQEMKKYKAIIDEIEKGESLGLGTDEQYENAIRNYARLNDELKRYKDSLSRANEETTVMGEVIPRLIELRECFERLARLFDKIAESGMKLLEYLVKPLELASEEYVEKFKSMREAVNGFVQHVQARLTKLSQFWKRTMKTFTFMLVRKAITAIIKEVGTAIQSLALFSNSINSKFNQSVSTLVADFQYLGRSLVAMFAPILDYIAPIIDVLVDRIGELINMIGLLFAALTGANTFTKAKKTVTNYAESLDKASKSAKNLTMGIDELNILNENSSSSSHEWDGWEDAWEQVDVPDWAKDLSEKIKTTFNDLFEPIKKAWDKTKDYVLDGWKFMTSEMSKLLDDIWRDFLRVWKSDTVEHIFENLFKILGDIERTIGNLAGKFREAWNEGEKGYNILKNLADNADILMGHFQNATEYLKEWSIGIDFNPLLKSFENLTDSFKDLSDFLGGLFEDVMKNVVLEYIKFMIEEGIPHLQNTIAEIIKAFDFDDLRAKLVPLEESFESLLEAIDIGKTEALGNLGKQIAEFSKTEDFERFLKAIEHIMDSITAEDVEKLLTGIGMGILGIGESLVKFIGSDTFIGFIDYLDKWYEKQNAEDIAKMIERIAGAIAAFKFASFASEGFAGFLTFATTLKGFQDLKNITKELGEIGTKLDAIGAGGTAAGAGLGAEGAAGGLTTVAGPAAIAALVIAAVATALYSLTKSYGGVSGLLDELGKRFDSARESAEKFSKAIGLDKSIELLIEQLKRLGEKLSDMKDFWDLELEGFGLFVKLVALKVLPILEVFIDFISHSINLTSTFVDILGGLATQIKGIFSGDWDMVWEGGKRVSNAFKEGFQNGWDIATKNVKDSVDNLPSDVDPVLEETNDSIFNKWNDILDGKSKETGTRFRASSKTAYETGLDAVTEVDYSKYASFYNSEQYEAMMKALEGTDYSKYGEEVNMLIGSAMTVQTDPIVKSNTETATKGAEAFTSTYDSYFKDDTTLSTTVYDYGQDTGVKLGEGISSSTVLNKNKKAGQKLVNDMFAQINSTLSKNMTTTQKAFTTGIQDMLSGKNTDITGAVKTLFATITTLVTANIRVLGNELSMKLLPSFMKTYIQPYFESGKWKPLFTALNTVLKTEFASIRVWFTASMNTWWITDLVPWFATTKWVPLFKAVTNCAKEQFEAFRVTWRTLLNSWWNNDVITWFSESKWSGLFVNLLTTVRTVFDKVYLIIDDSFDDAYNSVWRSCDNMIYSINDVVQAIYNLQEALNNINDFDVNFNVNSNIGTFASGGFPAYGSLFIAGETGAGAEFVGNVGGRTGVVNNDEITGIADAIYTTGSQESQLLAQLVQINRQILDKDPVVLGDKEVALMANRGQSRLGINIIT